MLDFIRDFTREAGFPPSTREMMDHFGFTAPNGIMCHLKALRKKGFLAWQPNLARTFRLTEAATKITRGIPVIDLRKVTEL